MANLQEINTYINELLETPAYPDSSANGLQVESSNTEIKTIALAVDSGLSVIKESINQNADLLIVHHGLFWGSQELIINSFGKKVETLLNNNCSLIAQHLPLDGNREVGNGAELAKFLGLQEIEGFWPIEDQFIGVKGKLKTPQDINYFIEKAKNLIGAIKPFTLEFGKDKIINCAIATGSGDSAIPFCNKEEFDLFISGEPKQDSYHKTKEQEINAIFMGHYATETFGVIALGKKLEDKFGIKTIFIDEPTGI